MNKLLNPIMRRIRLALGRGIIKLVKDTEGLQKIQLAMMQNETRSNIERFQEYGYTSHPLEGAEGAAIFIGGNRDHGIIVATDDSRYRPKDLEAGEVCIYTDEGDTILLKRNNEIVITTNKLTVNAANEIEFNTDIFTVNASTKVLLDTPDTETTGDLKDNIASNSDTIAEMRGKYNAHVHPENDAGGPTDEPNNTMGS